MIFWSLGIRKACDRSAVQHERVSWSKFAMCVYTCIFKHIYVYTHIHTYIHVYIHIQINICIHTYTYIYTCIHTYSYTYMYTHIYIHIHMYTYIFIWICVYTHIHTYIHIYVYAYIYNTRSGFPSGTSRGKKERLFLLARTHNSLIQLLGVAPNKHTHVYIYRHVFPHMGCLRFVGSLKSLVSCAKEPCKRDYILQKKPIILMSLVFVATA